MLEKFGVGQRDKDKRAEVEDGVDQYYLEKEEEEKKEEEEWKKSRKVTLEVRQKLKQEAKLEAREKWEKEKIEIEQKIDEIKKLVTDGVPVFKSESRCRSGSWESLDRNIIDEKSGKITHHSSHYLGGVDSSNHNSVEKWTPPREWIHLVTSDSLIHQYKSEEITVRHIVDGDCKLELKVEKDDGKEIQYDQWLFEQWGLETEGALEEQDLRKIYVATELLVLEVKNKKWKMIKGLGEFLEKHTSKEKREA